MVQNVAFWGETVIDARSPGLNGELTLPSLGSFFIYYPGFYRKRLCDAAALAAVDPVPRLSSDVVATLMVWGVLLWLSVLWAAWFLWRKKRPFEAVVPAFLLVALARTSADASSSVVLAMLGMTIGLMVLSAQPDRETKWRSKGSGSELIRKNTIQAALVLSAALVMSSAWLTSIDVDALRERWEEFTLGAESEIGG